MSLRLDDVAADGRVLLDAEEVRGQMRFGSFKDRSERDLSWFDYPTGMTMSADGKTIAFTESGQGAGAKYGVYVRPTNGDPAVRLADGNQSAISPDGRQLAVAGAGDGANSGLIRIVPTGAGKTRQFDLTRLEAIANLSWFPDNRRLTVVANEPKKKVRVFVLDSVTGAFEPLTPEGTRGRLVSPDGRWVAVNTGPLRQLFDMQTKSLVAVKGTAANDNAAGWSADSQALFISTSDGPLQPIRLSRLNPFTGERSLLTPIQPSDPSGLMQFGNLIVAPDGDHFLYGLGRQLSNLYLLKFP